VITGVFAYKRAKVCDDRLIHKTSEDIDEGPNVASSGGAEHRKAGSSGVE
jgi:hypothetical protein